jgi:hypothetical protein
LDLESDCTVCTNFSAILDATLAAYCSHTQTVESSNICAAKVSSVFNYCRSKSDSISAYAILPSLSVFKAHCAFVAGGSIPGIELSMPLSHIALSGDLDIQITSSSFPPLMLQLSRLEGNIAQPLTTFPVLPEARALSLNTTIVKIPCGYFSKGGQYYILLKKQPIGNTTSEDDQSSVITRSLDVRWPMPQLSLTPEYIQTYPERPVMAILEFPEVVCPPVAESPASAIPEFWLELHYCGHSLLCDNDDNRQNNSNVQVGWRVGTCLFL